MIFISQIYDLFFHLTHPGWRPTTFDFFFDGLPPFWPLKFKVKGDRGYKKWIQEQELIIFTDHR